MFERGARLVGPVIAAALLAVFVPSGASATEATAANSCAVLTGMRIPASAISLPTKGAVVESATQANKDAAGAATSFCDVTGHIAPVDPAAPAIRFRVSLPERWNDRAVQYGGGGYSGSIANTASWNAHGLRSGPTPIAQGWVVAGDDSGHQAPSSDDASFAVNDEALANFGSQHIKKTHDVVVALIQTRYGRPPKHFYFTGGSTGGREALTAAQRYPDAFDGVVANYPTADFLGLRLWGAALATAVYSDNSAGWIPPALVAKIAADGVEACDGLDGAKDGIVANMTACRAGAKARLQAMRCKGAADGQCLTPAQIDRTVAVYHEGYQTNWTAAGRPVRYLGYSALEGMPMQIGSQAQPMEPIKSGPNAHHSDRADQFMKFFVTRDPNFKLLSFDVHRPGKWEARLQTIAKDIGATSPDFDAFHRRGGKIIWAQGLDDASVSPYTNLALYQALVAHYGQAEADKFVRFYFEPGQGHGIGTFVYGWDNLKVLDDWVDAGKAPAQPVAYDTNAKTAGRSRPLCAYPTWPKYTGGDVDKADSFQCVK